MNRTRPALTDTVPIQTIRVGRPRPRTTGRGWHRGATQPVPVVPPREPGIARLRRLGRAIVETIVGGAGQESPAQQRALEHLAVQRLIGR